MSYDEKHFNEGITRKKINDKEFNYYFINNGKTISETELIRIKKLGIPPAWTNVWISGDPNSPIQVIGIDLKGRKQYKYHQIHIQKAEKEKFKRLYKFIKSIPRLVQTLHRDSQLPVYDKNRTISLMLMMVQDHYLRVGKQIYAKKNKSYGISSLRKRHVKILPNIVYLKFKGKSNQRLHYTITNPFYIQSIKILMKLSGDRLFQYITTTDSKEKIMQVSDKDLNKYIQDNMGSGFTVKDFRTYGANYFFIKSLLNETKKRTPKNRKIIKKNLVNAFKSTAKQLKHTGAVSKKSYVMSFAIELYQNDTDFFIKNKNYDYNLFLLKLLTLYKKTIID